MSNIRIGYLIAEKSDLRKDMYALSLLQMYHSVTFIPFTAFSGERNNWTSGQFDNETALGALAQGHIDTFHSILNLNERRVQHITFITPTWFNRLCFYVRKRERSSSRRMYFVEPLNAASWTMIACAFAICIFINKILNRRKFPFEILRPLPVMTAMFLGFFALLYNTLLQAQFSDGRFVVAPFQTAGQLAGLIRAKQFQLYLDSTEDFRMETLKTARGDYRELYEALGYNQPTIIPVEKICPRLARDAYAVYMEQELAIRQKPCGEHFGNILKICPLNAPLATAAYAVRKDWPELAENYTRLTGFFYVNQLEKQSTEFVTEKRANNSSTPQLLEQHPIPITTVAVMLWALGMSHCLSGLIVVIERRIFQHRYENDKS